MCGELDEDGRLGEELLDRLRVLARPWLESGAGPDRQDAFDAAAGDAALHLYMDRLFGDLLCICADDAEGTDPDIRADMMAAQSVVMARLAGVLAGLFPPAAETLKSGMEALMDGYGAGGEAPAHHHH